MKVVVMVAALALAVLRLQAQASWVHETKVDELHAETAEYFTLTGEYLTEPRAADPVDRATRMAIFEVR